MQRIQDFHFVIMRSCLDFDNLTQEEPKRKIDSSEDEMSLLATLVERINTFIHNNM